MLYPHTLQNNRMYANNCPECRVYFYHFCWTLLSKVIPGANGFSSLGRSFAMITYMKAHCRGELCFAVEAAKYEQQDGTKEMQGCLRLLHPPSAATGTILSGILTAVDTS